MRTAVRILALAFVLAGLQLSTGGVGYIFARLHAGFTAMGAGVEFHTSAPRFLSGVGALALGTTLWISVDWAMRAFRGASKVGTPCPLCGGSTARVRRRPWHRWIAFLVGQRLSRRKCSSCGWVGLTIGR